MKKHLLRLTFLFLLVSVAAHAQQVTGRVTSAADGSPVPGVSIVLKGTTTGTSTDADGKFSVEVPGESSQILVVSFIGYATQEISVLNKTVIDIALIEDITELGEVVVTALGIEKSSKSIGYATTKVDGSRFTESRELNLGSALTGQIPGVNVAGLGTGPTGSSRVVIRGNSSLTGANQPLYVIDGIPFDNSNQGGSGQWGGADYGDGLSNINPDNIESIQVLKGVAASALYGYRGGNGAILITTKSGKGSRGIGVEINNNFTANTIIDEREYQYEYGQGTDGVKPTTKDAALGVPTWSWGAKLDGSDAVNFLGETYKYSPQKDNFKNFFRTGTTNQASVAVTGSGDYGNFRLALTDVQMKTPIPNADMTQRGVNVNTTFNVTKKLQAGVTANYVFENVNNRASFSDAPGNVLAAPLYLANSFDIRWLEPATNPNGTEMLPGLDIYFNNPYFVAYKFRNETKRQRLTTGLKVKYDFNDWLSIIAQATRDGFIFNRLSITPSGTGYNNGGSISQLKTDTYELNGNVMLEFNKTFGSFSTRLNVGANSQDNQWERGGVDGAAPFVVPNFYFVGNTTNRPYVYEYRHSRVNSVFGSVDLGYKDYLYLTLTGRNDWFSTLAINSNSYLYPSAALSFVFSDAFELPEFISFGKLRASYGASSGGTDPYRNLLTYGLQGYTVSGQTLGYITQTQIPNNALKPIQITEQEIGFNVQLFNNRVEVDLAYYNKETTDDILPVTISPTSGYTGNIANIGSLRNRGFELLVSGSPVKSGDFAWDVSFNIANNNSEVLHISDESKEIVVDGAFPRWGNNVSIKHIVGKPYAQIVGYKYLRDESGNIIYDAGGFPKHSTEVEALGSGVYNVTGGLTNTVSYKGIRLSFLFDFKYGAKIYSGTNLLLYNNGLHQNTLVGREGGVIGQGVNEAGEPNDVSVPARVYYQGIATGPAFVAEEFVYDASFIKLRSLSIGYTLPKSILKDFFIKDVSLAFVARNVATLMKNTPNIDPEANLNNTNGQGLELSGYPMLRSYGFNVNLKF
jgi:TonB-linked SusC/RagA family outer membrane protein